MRALLLYQTSVFHIPEQDYFRYDPTIKYEIDFLSNACPKYNKH